MDKNFDCMIGFEKSEKVISKSVLTQNCIHFINQYQRNNKFLQTAEIRIRIGTVNVTVEISTANFFFRNEMLNFRIYTNHIDHKRNSVHRYA